ncbi:MAG: L,D-transpeptidase [Microcoleus sp. PH2017_10_PVI_O_A]|uniref:L,D-transpeptidase n=1 Tax=unclassified Microcoleus TaxID=2642155 RepID=UPI001DECE261|nr:MULTISPECIES: L,D-transpeptidase [unclassified Microcoleus]TAE82700.1 MAG: L,D-transpeptidase [Oscillatoriales cyanobacterium]MCC3404370.1 L,D-transpeptidase [Microcoleus sp. PH2017_10_PVI_O_A]MCC3458458.1 L,D-transpeptidase [Microcoleus sp. PH2017_11_PCY_U_A]MCC3477283.1 L,D-transpeptidase [Microcoleus sp. PH2017_12_PCY_D_A]MCC3530469.1 L,D-transpeptidase [Microcoleus sp. PH2017_21_RUC_O_A]
MVNSKFLFNNLIAIGLSAAALSVALQQQATAEPAANLSNSAIAQRSKSEVKLPNLGVPELPPLGEPSRYIPQEPNAPENAIEEVRLVLRLRERRVYVYRKNKVQASFPVAVGKGGWETPTGNFKITHMIKDPVWEHPWTGELVPAGPDNPLGSRWIGFWTDGKNVIGFHGTPNPESIGRAASHGCVRMFDKDAQALFEKVAVGTPVIVEK